MGRFIKFGILLALSYTIASQLSLASDLAVLQNGYSIRHERREIIGSVTRLYTGENKEEYVDIPSSQIDHFEQDLSPQPKSASMAVSEAGIDPAPRIDDLVNGASSKTQIDPDLINSVIRAESGFNPKALSPKGAQGLMQLMPQTASRLGVSDSFDAAANIDGGTRYLRELLDLYNFDMVKALAAYNAGPQRIEQYHGVPPYRETRAYVARIVRDFNRQKLAERKAAHASTVAKSNSAVNKKPASTSPGNAAPAKSAELAANTSRP